MDELSELQFALKIIAARLSFEPKWVPMRANNEVGRLDVFNGNGLRHPVVSGLPASPLPLRRPRPRLAASSARATRTLNAQVQNDFVATPTPAAEPTLSDALTALRDDFAPVGECLRRSRPPARRALLCARAHTTALAAAERIDSLARVSLGLRV